MLNAVLHDVYRGSSSKNLLMTYVFKIAKRGLIGLHRK